MGWRVEAAEAESRLRLRWRERGGPPVAAPAARGFGIRFVEFAAARELGGRAELSYLRGETMPCRRG